MNRRGYLDWLRGVATLLMIEAHTYDAWTRPEDRVDWPYRLVIFLGGFAAPGFLFLAGVALAVAASSREERGATPREAAARARKRGWQAFGLAFLFRVQSMVISGGRWPQALLKVDILNVIGLSLVCAGALWPLFRTPRARAFWFVMAAAVLALAAPSVRAAHWPAVLPEWLGMYVRAFPGRTSFSLFPWPAFLFVGVVVGQRLAAASTPDAEREAVARVGAWGGGLLVVGLLLAFLPPLRDPHASWTTAPAFFLVRVGILMAGVSVAYMWSVRSPEGWSPVRELGLASLFVYWIHVEMAYGRPVAALHRSLTFAQASWAYLGLVAFLWGLVRLKARAATWWPKLGAGRPWRTA